MAPTGKSRNATASGRIHIALIVELTPSAPIHAIQHIGHFGMIAVSSAEIAEAPTALEGPANGTLLVTEIRAWGLGMVGSQGGNLLESAYTFVGTEILRRRKPCQ